MSTNITGFNKSKEDFIWFVKKAVSDKKSDAHAELYQTLLKMFAEADTNRDGLVSKASFSQLVDKAATLPRLYGFAPTDEEMFKNDQEKEQARAKLFSSLDVKSTGVITFDEWYKFAMEHIASKVATLAAHPILDKASKQEFLQFLKMAKKQGTPENTELYWYLVELFTEADSNKNGLITKAAFPALVESLLAIPKKLNIEHPYEALYADDAKKVTFLDGLFIGSNPVGDEKMTVDEWIAFAMKFYKKIMPQTKASIANAGFNKSKPDFIWFIKKAVANNASSEHAELYNALLKMFVDADTNNDGLVSKEHFSKLIDIAATVPRLYGFAPTDDELYKTEDEKEKARQRMFEAMDKKNTGVITFDEWYKFSMQHIAAKTATLADHPILDLGTLPEFKKFLESALNIGTAENTELYWLLLGLFTKADGDQDGLVTLTEFPELFNKLIAIPKKLGVEITADPKVLFKKYNPVGDDKLCLDEFIGLAIKEVFKKIQ